MWKPSTCVIEMTGILGAGYLPGMFKELQTQLMRHYIRVNSNGDREPIVAMYHVDNTAMLRWNRHKRNEINFLVQREQKDVDLSKYVEAVKLHDELFKDAVEDWNSPVDLVFRRGGLLQNFVWLNRKKWRSAIVESTRTPKLQVFLWADYDIIASAYSDDQDVRRVIEREPQAYNPTPESALEEQDRWHSQIKDLPGVIAIQRKAKSKKQFVSELLATLKEPIGVFGCRMEERMKVFISYSSKDEEFANKIYSDLIKRGIPSWLAPHDMPIGAKILDSIDTEIRQREKMILVLSENAISSDWVEDEVIKAFSEERRRGRPVVFPVRLDDSVMQTTESWAAKIRDQRNIGDFRNWNDGANYQRGLERVIRDLTKT